MNGRMIRNGLRIAVRYEIGMWASLFRWVTRRPVTAEPGTAGFGYTGPVATLLWVFIVVSAVEVPIMHLILPWRTAQVISLIVGGYGLIWMIGLFAMLKVHPHLVGPAGVRVRNGISMDVMIPWTAIDTLRVRRRSLPPGGTIQLEQTAGAPVLSLGVSGLTTVDVLLREPMTVPVRKSQGAAVGELRFQADDPEALVAMARTFLQPDQTRVS